MQDIRVFIAAIVLSLCSARPGMAAIQVGPPFGEHMVLQQGVPVPIWGSGCPGGDTVRVSFNGQSVTAKSDWAGRWLVILAPMEAGGPYQMLVQIGGVGRLVNSSAATAQGFVEPNDIAVQEISSLDHGMANGFPSWQPPTNRKPLISMGIGMVRRVQRIIVSRLPFRIIGGKQCAAVIYSFLSLCC